MLTHWQTMGYISMYKTKFMIPFIPSYYKDEFRFGQDFFLWRRRACLEEHIPQDIAKLIESFI